MAKKDVRLLLREAALSLFAAHGYEATTTADVAAKAGVTERTLFRHFPDKRELLFDDEACGYDLVLAAVEAAPPALAALDALYHAFASVEDRLVASRAFMEGRFRLIASSPALQEREASKLIMLADALAERLTRRADRPLEAALAARIGTAALRDALEQWFSDPACRFGERLARSRAALSDLVVAG